MKSIFVVYYAFKMNCSFLEMFSRDLLPELFGLLSRKSYINLVSTCRTLRAYFVLFPRQFRILSSKIDLERIQMDEKIFLNFREFAFNIRHIVGDYSPDIWKFTPDLVSLDMSQSELSLTENLQYIIPQSVNSLAIGSQILPMAYETADYEFPDWDHELSIDQNWYGFAYPKELRHLHLTVNHVCTYYFPDSIQTLHLYFGKDVFSFHIKVFPHVRVFVSDGEIENLGISRGLREFKVTSDNTNIV